MDGFCGDGLLEYVKKSRPPPFLLKTYMLVDDPAMDGVISWNAEGTAFVVWQPAEFARDLLPTLFKHSNFSSFIRQLNTYGFRKVAANRWEFCNDMFQKGKSELLGEIRRRKASANRKQPTSTPNATASEAVDEDQDQRSSSTSSSSEYSTLVDENKRLRKENGMLSSELSSMKNKCKELLDLVAMYTSPKEEEDGNGEGDDDNHRRERPKLFGVRLEVQGEMEKKRKRAEIRESARILMSQSCK
ncbi:hypothetical protein Nepgr_020546 [Nepenthes gracilis]|uniref:HSF-type DNA-binding domain-containing protein n=1 Tax=Nepenthes gracilis TaxID=150966 RepID=A0AAD3XWD4_NEPGR|nr:hypothetical protein Nepgr_020546 [Nepenthes gracilis]